MQYPSLLIEEAIQEISKLPGIGKKTALRLSLHLLKSPEEQTLRLADALVNLRKLTTYCDTCHIIADTTACTCKGLKTDTTVVCVVENTPEVIAIKNTGQYNGMFHVLGGLIAPMQGIGPDQLHIESLLLRLQNTDENIREVILALSPTMEGDTTAFYISKKIKHLPIKITTIARGVPIGGDLEYADEITLGRSIITRTQYDIS